MGHIGEYDKRMLGRVLDLYKQELNVNFALPSSYTVQFPRLALNLEKELDLDHITDSALLDKKEPLQEEPKLVEHVPAPAPEPIVKPRTSEIDLSLMTPEENSRPAALASPRSLSSAAEAYRAVLAPHGISSPPLILR